MRDKNDDTFFDEDTSAAESEQRLMSLVDTHPVTTRTYKKGAAVSGTVVRVGEEYAFLDIGAKNEAVMRISELLDEKKAVKVKPGDIVKCYVVSEADADLTVSASMGSQGEASLPELVEAMRARLPVQGKVTGIAKAGLSVKVMGRRAFCPVSQIENRFVEDVNPYLNKTMDFVITRVEEGGRNVVVSRIPIVEKVLEASLDALAADAGSQKTFRGTITRITDFGLFVDLGVIEGLVHISEVSWDRVDKLAELFAPGQAVECLLLTVEKKQPMRDSRVSLSIRKVLGDPWTDVATKFPLGSSVDGTVTRLADFGAFVRIMSGIEGLVHVSEMSWAKRIRHPSDVVKVGQQVRVTILAVDEKKRTVSLSLKDLEADPWKEVPARYPVGAVVNGVVATQARYGFFVDMQEGVTGLLVNQNIAVEKKDGVKVGATIEVRIESIDIELRRISLSCGMAQQVQETKEIEEFLSKQQAPAPAATAAPVSEFAAALRSAFDKKK